MEPPVWCFGAVSREPAVLGLRRLYQRVDCRLSEPGGGADTATAYNLVHVSCWLDDNDLLTISLRRPSLH